MAEEKKREAESRDNSRQDRSRNLEFQIRTENSAEQQQRRKRSDPKGDLLEPRWLDSDDLPFQSSFFGQIRNRINNRFCE
jgi:hypothetical protein